MMWLQHQLEKEVKKSPEERIATPDQLLDLRHQSIAQIIYEDNRVSELNYAPDTQVYSAWPSLLGRFCDGLGTTRKETASSV